MIHGDLNDRVYLFFLAHLTFREVGRINLADSQAVTIDREVQMGMASAQFAPTLHEVRKIYLADSQVDLVDREVQMGMVSTQFALALNASLPSMASAQAIPIWSEAQYLWY